ncbi:MAG TPA: phosphoribosylformylglycinamidine cyclo-ligase [Thermoleophilaceae bacterium]|nr:phosphoribosylformylglycinamidine cyclo-ligase [Thermoleophilaceae bacterium]
MAEGAYARAGVDTSRADSAISALVGVLRTIDIGKPSRVVLGSGHYATVIDLNGIGLALSTDGVGSKVIVAEQLGRYDTVGIDCIAMNVNDLVCVGAEPVVLLDYIAVEEADPEVLRQIGVGLKEGAEQAGVEIPGGELAQLPELIRGHPSPRGFDLAATSVGIVALDAIVTGDALQPGDAVIGLRSNGLHSNGYTLARRTLPDLEEAPPELGGSTVGEELLRPTAIYVRAALELLRSPDIDVRGLAHITGDGFLNLPRLSETVGWSIDTPLPVPPVCELIAERASVAPEDMWETFNMGCGFCCVVPSAQADAATALLGDHHPGAAVIGSVTSEAGLVELPFAGLTGRRGEGFRRA